MHAGGRLVLTPSQPPHFTHTSYQVDIGDKLKQILTDDIMSDVVKRHDARKEVRGVLKDR